jgi:drug/metabolite transporter (DMT)-like permease
MWPLFCCVFILACCALLNKHAISGSNPFSIQLINVCVSLSLSPLWFILAKRAQANSGEGLINKSSLIYVIAAGVLSTIGFILFLTALKNKPASVATSVLSIYPVVAAIFGAALGLEKFTPIKFGGVLITLIGVLITLYFG